MTAVAARARRALHEFRLWSGREPEGVWAAPGRVNLVGEHTDYNDGFVLPVTIDREAVVAVARRDDLAVRATSMQLGAATPVSLADLPGSPPADWAAYVAGVAWVLGQQGLPVTGLDVVVDSDVPLGAGLSSSAALACAVALALGDLSGARHDRVTLALAAQRAEQDVVGAPVGVMDQMVSMLGRADSALLLDCRTLHTEHLPLHLDDAGFSLVVIDTRVSHAHASGSYADRRAECAQAARFLGVPALRDATVGQLHTLTGTLRRRARHVLTENDRVLAAAAGLRRGDIVPLGPVLRESHASLRDDFEVSVPELDAAADAAVTAGALGARMVGGGFGGSAIALVTNPVAAEVRRRVEEVFDSRGFQPPSVFTVRTAGAGRRLEVS